MKKIDFSKLNFNPNVWNDAKYVTPPEPGYYEIRGRGNVYRYMGYWDGQTWWDYKPEDGPAEITARHIRVLYYTEWRQTCSGSDYVQSQLLHQMQQTREALTLEDVCSITDYKNIEARRLMTYLAFLGILEARKVNGRLVYSLPKLPDQAA